MTATPPYSEPDREDLVRSQKRLAIALGLIFSLSAVVVFLLGRKERSQTIDDPALIAAAIQSMMALGDGLYDSHSDPEVAKVLQPSLDDIEYRGDIILTTNTFGVREKQWQVPKPPGMVRVVILGDSFVLGSGINANQRMGAHLERYLKERMRGFEGEVEVLQIGMGSWNIQSECAYARRQMSLLRPDLLIHLLVNNDLDDSLGVRGFGGFARTTPQQPDHVTGVIQRRYPKQTLRGAHTGWLSNGLDWESRSRFKSALGDLKELQSIVVAQGGKYQVFFAWGKFLQSAYQGLGRHFTESDSLYMSPVFGSTPAHRVSPTDGHWGPRGNELVGRMLYATIVERELLPKLNLEAWGEADRLKERYLERGREEAKQEVPVSDWLERVPIASEITFGKLESSEKAQIHGGLTENGIARPYCSMILANAGETLQLEGFALQRPEMKALTVDVMLDEFVVATLELETGKRFELELPIPTELRGREFLTLRCQASDYVYVGPNMRRCISYRLDRVALQ